jgi:hypothetical protein
MDGQPVQYRMERRGGADLVFHLRQMENEQAVMLGNALSRIMRGRRELGGDPEDAEATRRTQATEREFLAQAIDKIENYPEDGQETMDKGAIAEVLAKIPHQPYQWIMKLIMGEIRPSVVEGKP